MNYPALKGEVSNRKMLSKTNPRLRRADVDFINLPQLNLRTQFLSLFQSRDVLAVHVMDKKAQVTIFIIIALIIVAGIAVFFLVKENITTEEIPSELSPVFDYYESCIEQEAHTAVRLAGLQAGHVALPVYIPGSEYAPFSSHLNFLGGPVPYWYYISANGIIKEQVPSKSEMEREIADYIQKNLDSCDFESFYQQGFSINLKDPTVNVQINDLTTNVEVSSDLTISKADISARKTTHQTEIDTKLGKFYKLAKEIYNKEKQEAFLEKYAVDVLYSYAPVDGVEIQCIPKVWTTTNVFNDIKQGLEENFRTIKLSGNYYELKSKEREYFVVDKHVDEAVNIMYSKDWPIKIEISGDGVDEQFIIAEAVGTQEGLGIMGFCYVPYHFVYDVSFPTLIQIYNQDELFQFPVAVIINKNLPRDAEFSILASDEEDFDLCEFKTQDIEVNIFNINLNKVDANISFECFSQRCRLGESKNGKFIGKAPACVNGFLHLRASGYSEKKQLFSTNDEKFADVILEREYDVTVNLKVGGQPLKGTAIVSFTKDDGKTTALSLPEIKNTKLSEGNYEIKVYVYGNSSITLPSSTKTECVEVPRQGLLGFLGSTKEKCFDITIPATKIEHALIGGGTTQTYILESELEKSQLTLNVDRLPQPTSIETLQQNFELFETKNIGVLFNEN